MSMSSTQCHSPALPSDRSLRWYRQLFSTLSPPDEASLVGDYQAVYLGPAWLRHLARLNNPLIGLPGWAGKRFNGQGEAVNLVSGRIISPQPPPGQPLMARCPMQVHLQQSLWDNKPALVLQYTAPGTPMLLRLFRDELRAWNRNTLLALAVIQIPGFRWLTGPVYLPFALVRQTAEGVRWTCPSGAP